MDKCCETFVRVSADYTSAVGDGGEVIIWLNAGCSSSWGGRVVFMMLHEEHWVHWDS